MSIKANKKLQIIQEHICAPTHISNEPQNVPVVHCNETFDFFGACTKTPILGNWSVPRETPLLSNSTITR